MSRHRRVNHRKTKIRGQSDDAAATRRLGVFQAGGEVLTGLFALVRNPEGAKATLMDREGPGLGNREA